MTSVSAFEVLQLLKGTRTPQLNTKLKSHWIFVGLWKKLIGCVTTHLVNLYKIVSNEIQNMNNYFFPSKLITELRQTLLPHHHQILNRNFLQLKILFIGLGLGLGFFFFLFLLFLYGYQIQ